DTFERDLEDPQIAERVREDALGGVRSGVHGTPTFFVNGQMIEGGYREQEIEVALADARQEHER
ncbi:MAG: DsbA family protein, partial [bacterium]|nr:DsbA family protein [bacterium]